MMGGDQRSDRKAAVTIPPPRVDQLTRAPQPPQRRVYQEWQGSEVFFCWGRCIAGPNYRSLGGTTLLVLAPLVVYVIFVGEVLQREVSLALPAVGVGLGVLALLFLYRTGCMDPGILPRQEPDEEARMGQKPKGKEVMVNGHKVMVRYNETCHFYQPPRAHHCSVNDNCVEKFDHHCPWVGTTIGLRNYRWFLMFIFTASTLCIYVCVTSVLTIKLEFDQLRDESKDKEESKPSVSEAFREAPAAVALASYTALFFLFVGGLSFFHMYLVSTNQTTYENFRYGYDRSANPYDQGCLRNWASVWCIPTPPSKVDFRAYVDPRRSVEDAIGTGMATVGRPGLPISNTPSSPEEGRKYPLSQLSSAYNIHGEGGPRSGFQQKAITADADVTIDVEMGPMEIRHNPEGGGKLQVVYPPSSKEFQQLAGLNSPVIASPRKAWPADNGAQ